MSLIRKILHITVPSALVLFGLSACNLPVPEASRIFESINPDTPDAVTPTLPEFLTPETVLTQEGEETSCGFMWATQPLPEVTTSL